MPLDLARVGRKSYVSQNALAAILKAVKEEELPKGISRPVIKRRREAATNVETPYGPIFQKWTLACENGGTAVVHFCQPAAMLWFLTQESTHLAEFLRKRLQDRPSTIARPWSIIFYSDEVTPGNQLKVTNARKLQAIYFSFSELSANALAHERAWFLPAAVRSSTVATLKAGMSQVCRAALLSFSADGGFFECGVQLRPPEGGATLMLCAAVRCLLSDESALKHMLCNKGASGKIPCGLCRNVVQKRYAPKRLHNALVVHTCPDASKFLLHTRESLAECVNHLATQAARLNKGEMDDLQLRLDHAPEGLLSSRELMEKLDVPKAVMYDYMHVYCVTGLFHLEVNLLLGMLAKRKIKAKDFHAFFQDFEWPQFIGSNAAGARDVFQRMKKAEDDFKCSASQVLGSYPVMRLFAAELLQTRTDRGEAKGGLQCFLLLCDVLDLLGLAARDNGACVAGRLKAVEDHVKAFTAIHGDENLPPKVHYALHLPLQLEHHQQLFSCWVHERRHKELKRFADNLHKAVAESEISITREMLLSHVDDLKEQPIVVPAGLSNPRRASAEVLRHFQEFAGVAIGELQASAKTFFAPNRWCSSGDKVLLTAPATMAEVIYHCEFDGQLLTCVRFYAKTDKPNTFRLQPDAVAFVLAENIQGACISKSSEDGLLTVAPQMFSA